MDSIRISHFEKSYGDLKAVDDVSLSVKKSELFGLIGPDGAGKTTTMRSVCTLLAPDQGSIHVNDLDVTRQIKEIRSILGYMPQRFSLYQDLSVEQNLKFFADLFQVPPAEQQSRLKQLYEFSKLVPFKTRRAGALSGGMKQKLALSCALIHTPDILVLDEPTFGVDPVSRQEFWELLHTLQKQGTTILVSTAYMDEANLCDRVALFFRGKIVATDTPENLKKSYSYPLYRLESSDVIQLRNFFKQQPGVHTTQLFGNALHVSFKKKPGAQQMQEWKNNPQIQIDDIKQQSPSIEDVFLDLMGNEK